MLGRKAALAGLASCALVGSALAEPKTNLLSQWSEGSDAAAIAKLGDMFTAAGGKWQATSIAGHTANTLAKLRADVDRRQRAARRAAQGPGDRRVERDRQDRQPRRSRHQGRLGQGGGARASAGDEADRPLGRRADEHPPHQLDLGLHQGDGAGRHQGAAEDLGRVQRRLRQGGRRASDLPRAFQPGLDRRRRCSRSSSTGRASTSSARPSSRATPRRCARRTWSRRSSNFA